MVVLAYCYGDLIVCVNLLEYDNGGWTGITMPSSHHHGNLQEATTLRASGNNNW